jgi:hypothetical protein
MPTKISLTIRLCANFESAFCGDKSNLACVGFPCSSKCNDNLKFEN